MTHTITMSPEEYYELVTKQNEPSKLLEETYKNTKLKLDAAYKRIKELEESLTQYSLAHSVKRMDAFVDELREEEVEKEYTTSPEKEVVHRASTIHRRWTPEEDSILHNAVNNRSLVTLVIELGRSLKAVKSRAYALGYITRNNYIRRKSDVGTD